MIQNIPSLQKFPFNSAGLLKSYYKKEIYEKKAKEMKSKEKRIINV